MIDRYTKVVLTVIAGALLILCAKELAPKAVAQYGGCGQSGASPCYVAIAQPALQVWPLEMKVVK